MHKDNLSLAIEATFKCNQKMCNDIILWFDGAEIQEVDDFLYEFFLKSGAMPYGVAKARTGDPFNWIANEMQLLFREYL